ncbi:MAG TPA: tol-pal system protein YbgF [Gammaproteobacteria bacterium]|nr:tol-pal system protein YbgF [Gammaproteobacteria bacterium]
MTPLAIRSAILTVLLIAAATVVPLQTADAASTKERLDSIERKLDSRGLLDMLSRIEQMQRDIQQLRGEIELQTHTLKDIQRRSREQYMDIDRRLQQLESGNTAMPVPVAPGAVTPPAVTAPDPLHRPPMSRPPGAAAVVTLPPQAGEKEEYDTALAVLREGRYAEAVQAFNRFLVNYPGSSYADNASYWLGETYYVTRDFNRALVTFQGLVEQYPNSPKVADSRLKMGYIHYEKQDWSAARQTLDAVVSDYPGSTAARLASDRLKKMKKAGH